MAVPGNIPLLFLFIFFLFIEYHLTHNKLLLPAYSSEDKKEIVVNQDKKNKWKATEKEHAYN